MPKVKAHSVTRNGKCCYVKGHYRKDKWPPVNNLSYEGLKKYKARVVKEITGLSNGTLTAEPRHKLFIYRRLKQVNKKLASS